MGTARRGIAVTMMLNEVFVSLDLEMTTPRPEHQEVIEIAAVKFKGDRVVDTFTTLVNPRQPIPYNIQVLTGIKQEVVDRAPTLPEVAGQLIAFIKDHPLVAHTISSDTGCLQRKGIHLSNPQIDTFELASILLPQLPNYGLAAVAEHFGIPITSQHRAAGDALMTGKVFQALVRKALELDLSIVQEINRLTQKLDWSLRPLFREIEAAKSRTTFSGSSIREQLAAKGGLEEAAFDFMYLGRARREPLTSREPRRPVDVEQAVGAFEPGGALEGHFPGYEHRPQQTEMARAVCAALNESAHLVVEAGTGTGKSLAYLLPAAYFATTNAERVVISTNTINLQDQLFGKDIPDVKAATGLPFKAALVKGRANYLCQLRFAGMRRHQELTPDEIFTLIKVLVWLPTTRTGDIVELNLVDGQRAVWNKLYAPAESCLGNHCPYFQKGTCFVYRARDEAASAHIVVVNHSLLLSDMMVKSKVLPEYRFLVVDEAHHFEDEATEQLGFRLTQRDILGHLDGLSEPIGGERHSGLLSELKAHLRGSGIPVAVERELDAVTKRLHEEVDAAREAAKSFGRTLAEFVKKQGAENRGYDARLRLTAAVRARSGWDEVELEWENCSLCLLALQDGLNKIVTILERYTESNVLEYEALMANLVGQLHANQELRQRATAVVVRPTVDEVCWLALSNQSSEVSLHAAPLHVGEALDKYLFETKESVILTSATLSTAGSFRYVKDRLGLAQCHEVLVDSPFDYASSTLLYVPNDIPEPERPNYQRQVEQAVIELCRATGGRALVLFTSYGQLGQTLKGVRRALEEQRIQVLAQEPGGRGPSRRQLLENFKKNERAVLLGAASFWEGVDVVGDALSLLIITRLPFAVPTDPVVAARSEQCDDPFNEYSLPRTILRFKQGFGRLIRSKTDRGVVVVLDRRIQSKFYGQAFIRSLPRCTLRSGPLQAAPNAAAAWLGGQSLAPGDEG